MFFTSPSTQTQQQTKKQKVSEKKKQTKKEHIQSETKQFTQIFNQPNSWVPKKPSNFRPTKTTTPGLLRDGGGRGGVLHGVGGAVEATADDGLWALEPWEGTTTGW